MRLSPEERLRGKATKDPAGTSGRTYPLPDNVGSCHFASTPEDSLKPLTAHGRGLYAAKNRAAKCFAENRYGVAGRINDTVALF